MKKTFILSIIYLFFGSIILAQQTDSNCTKIYRMKYYRFSKLRYQNCLKESWDKIDTNSVYLSKNEKGYVFIRFFAAGVYFASKTYTNEPGEKEYNDLCNGILDMYTFKDGKIITEHREPDWGADGRRWGYNFCTLKDDSLIFYKYERGRSLPLNYKIDYFYVKKKVTLYNFNWSSYSSEKNLRIRRKK